MAILDKVPVTLDEGLQPWFVKRAAELTGAVGRVSVAGRNFGTGFLISPRLVLTCHSVVPDEDTAKESAFELDYQRDEDGAFRRVTTVRLDPQAYFVADKALDLAIVALATELKDRPVIGLTDAEGGSVGQRVSLFHHPRGGPLQLSLRAGAVLAVYDDVVHHDANTEPGSSGGPLLDQNLRLIGVHHASVPRGDVRARETVSSARGQFIANEAIRVTAILAMLAQRDPLILARLNVAGETVPSPAPAGTPAAPQAPAPASDAGSEVVEAGAPVERDAVFISYARGDQGKRKWRDRLQVFLEPFRDEVDVWDDSRIETGAEWRTEIDIALKRARVAVLLVGPSFLGSEFIAKNELPPLLKAAEEEGVIILPLITNHCSYDKTELGKYQAFNNPKKPLEGLELADQNEWLTKFAERIDEAFRGAV